MPLHGKEPGERAQDRLSIRPQFALLAEVAEVPRFRMPGTGLAPDTAYQVVHDELLLTVAPASTWPRSSPRGWSPKRQG